jgi:rubrerythrin
MSLRFKRRLRSPHTGAAQKAMSEPPQQGEKHDENHDQTQVRAYPRMVERVREALHGAEHEAFPSLRRALDSARDKAVELGELTSEEAERISDYVLRDLREAAEYLAESGEELSSWLQFDLELIGARIAEHLPLLVDQTRAELDRLSQEAQDAGEWETGEVTVGGTFRCANCGYIAQFQGPTRIDACPRCGGNLFKRVAGPESFSGL